MSEAIAKVVAQPDVQEKMRGVNVVARSVREALGDIIQADQQV